MNTLLASPWVLLTLLAIPLVIAVVRLRIYPTAAWTIWLVPAIVGSLAVVAAPSALVVVLVIDAVGIAVVLIDATRLIVSTGGAGGRGIVVSRQLPRTCSLGVPVATRLTVQNRCPGPLRGQVRDDVPDGFVAQPPHSPLVLAPGRRAVVTRTLTPHRRGAFELHRVDLQLQSPLGLWRRLIRCDLHDRINVYPNIKQLGDYELLARTDRLSQIGVRRVRRIGQDSDFERLRDYTPDDNYRHIDWRSTARRNRLTTRQFQSDQSQRLVFLLDCGRMMTGDDGQMTMMDHSLNAALLLSYVALARGDAVGMVCFSDTVHTSIPPRGGRGQINRLVQAGFNQSPRMVESRYDEAFVHLRRQFRRRSLVILMTNVIDEVNAAAIGDHLVHLTGTHLPMAVVLRDRDLFEAADAPRELAIAGRRVDDHCLYRGAAAADLLLWRHQTLARMAARGVLVIDTPPDDLNAPLVNAYLKVKAKHLL